MCLFLLTFFYCYNLCIPFFVLQELREIREKNYLNKKQNKLNKLFKQKKTNFGIFYFVIKGII